MDKNRAIFKRCQGKMVNGFHIQDDENSYSEYLAEDIIKVQDHI